MGPFSVYFSLFAKAGNIIVTISYSCHQLLYHRCVY